MNWYKKRQISSDVKDIKSSVLSNSPEEKMKKYASIDGSGFNSDIAVPASTQDGNYFTVFDIQRYVFDSYTVKTALSQTDRKISVSILTNHAFLGTIAWDQYWFYDLDDMKTAKKTYKSVNGIVKDVMEEFIAADGDMPTPMFWGYLKKACDDVDNSATIRSNIPYINYANQYRHLSNPDWRSNLYGGRYPKYQENSFKDYKEIQKKLWGN